MLPAMDHGDAGYSLLVKLKTTKALWLKEGERFLRRKLDIWRDHVPWTKSKLPFGIWMDPNLRGLMVLPCNFMVKVWTLSKWRCWRQWLSFFTNGKLPKGRNTSFTALVPVVGSPQSIKDFQPISLIGSVYEIASKVLTAVLREVIGELISDGQCVFVGG